MNTQIYRVGKVRYITLILMSVYEKVKSGSLENRGISCLLDFSSPGRGGASLTLYIGDHRSRGDSASAHITVLPTLAQNLLLFKQEPIKNCNEERFC